MGSPAGTVVVRVTPGLHWHALEEDVVVGRGHALHRPDGRVLISVDSWRDDVFETLALAMVDDLGRSVRTVVDDDDREVLARWSALGFRDDRRDVEYLVAIDPSVTGLPDQLPEGTVLLAAHDADPDQLASLDHELRRQLARTMPWAALPAVTVPPAGADHWSDHLPGQRPDHLPDYLPDHLPDHLPGPRADRLPGHQPDHRPTIRLVAVRNGEYAGLVRISASPRRARLGLVAVLPKHRRAGVARALLAEQFRRLHADGVRHVTAEVDETAVAARALLRGVGARETGRVVEMALGTAAGLPRCPTA